MNLRDDAVFCLCDGQMSSPLYQHVPTLTLQASQEVVSVSMFSGFVKSINTYAHVKAENALTYLQVLHLLWIFCSFKD